jgi:V-type H+-transporting ATPase subunit a
LTAQCEKAQVRVKEEEEEHVAYTRPRSVQEIDELEQTLIDIESRLLQMNESSETLNKRFLELNELQHVLRETALFFDEVRVRLEIGS